MTHPPVSLAVGHAKCLARLVALARSNLAAHGRIDPRVWEQIDSALDDMIDALPHDPDTSRR